MNSEQRLKSQFKANIESCLHDLQQGQIGVERCADSILHVTATFNSTMQDELIKNEEKYRLIAENAQDVIWTMNLDAEFTYISPSILKLSGYTPEEAMKQSILDTIAPEFKQEVALLFEHSKSCLAKYERFPASIIQLKQLCKDGSSIWVEVSINGLYNDNNEFIGVYGVLRNIEERKRNEAKLKASEESFKGLFNSVKEAIYIQNREGVFLDVNAGAAEMYGYDRKYLIGKTPDFLSAEGKNDVNNLALALKKAFEGEEMHFDFWGKRKNGEVFPKAVSLYPGKYMGENVVIALAKDITDVKLTEERLNNERRLLQTIINSAPFCIYVKNKKFQKILTNNVGIPALDFSESEMCNKTDFELFPPEIAEGFIKDDKAVINQGKSIINKHEFIYNKNKEKIWLQTSKVPWRDENNNIKGLVGFGIDITKQKKTELIQKMLYNISRVAIHSNTLNDLIKAIHHEIKMALVTENFFCGIYDKETHSFFAPFFEDNVDKFDRWPAEKTFSGYTLKQNCPVLLNENDIEALVRSGEASIYGTKPKSWLSVPLNVNNEVIGILAIQSYNNPNAYSNYHREILEMLSYEISVFILKKRTELELVEAKERAIESDKLKSTFLANMSHEIRTPMNAIVGFSELLDDDSIEPKERSSYTRIIQQRSFDLLTLIDDILDISKIEAGQIKIVNSPEDINEILISQYESFKLLWIDSKKTDIQFKLQICREIEKRIFTDPARVGQVISNLLNNAFKFTQKGTITLGCKKVSGNAIRVFVEDTGIGIENEKHALVFERFRQANNNTVKFGGAGLGLSISKGLVEALGGIMQLKSTPGKGSVFSFTLPI